MVGGKVEKIKIVYTGHNGGGKQVFCRSRTSNPYAVNDPEIVVLVPGVSFDRRVGSYRLTTLATMQKEHYFPTATEAIFCLDRRLKENGKQPRLFVNGWSQNGDQWIYNNDASSPTSYTNLLTLELQCTAGRCLNDWCPRNAQRDCDGHCNFCAPSTNTTTDNIFIPKLAGYLMDQEEIECTCPIFSNHGGIPTMYGVKCEGNSGCDIFTSFNSDDYKFGLDMFAEQDDDHHANFTQEKEYGTMMDYLNFTDESSSFVTNNDLPVTRYGVVVHTGQERYATRKNEANQHKLETQAKMVGNIYLFLLKQVNVDAVERLIDRHWVIYVDYESVVGNQKNDHVTYTLKQFANIMNEDDRPRVFMIKSKDWKLYSDLGRLLLESEVELDEDDGVVYKNDN